MGGGDETKTTTKLPAWLENSAKNALATGEKIAKIGYVPWMGPDVAAFSPQQVRGMQGVADWNAAFNTPGQAAPNIASELMPAQDFGGGLKGYSSYGGFSDAVAKLRDQYPGLANYLDAFFINPTTGKFPGGGPGGIGGDPVVPPTTPPVTPPTGGGGGGGSGGGGGGGGGTGGPPPPGSRVPGQRGRMPNGAIWHINQKGQLVIGPTPGSNLGFGGFGEGGKGNFRSREGYAGGNPTRL